MQTYISPLGQGCCRCEMHQFHPFLQAERCHEHTRRRGYHASTRVHSMESARLDCSKGRYWISVSVGEPVSFQHRLWIRESLTGAGVSLRLAYGLRSSSQVLLLL